MVNNTLPPQPAQIDQKIIQGKFIDFSVLLRTQGHIPGCHCQPLATAQPIKKFHPLLCGMHSITFSS